MSTSLLVALSVLLLLILRRAFTLAQNYRFAKAHGCQAPARLPQSERILGWGNFKHQVAMAKEKKLLPGGMKRFDEIGDTYSAITMGRPVILTREPENVKAILATNFKDFGIGARYKVMGALLGKGIFTSDGALWEHSRVGKSVFQG